LIFVSFKPWLFGQFLLKLIALTDGHEQKNTRRGQARPSNELESIIAEKGLAQERLALDAGVDRTVVGKIERAKTNPSLDVLLRLANHLDTTLDRLLQARKTL
jgi:DNA-binding XRE family transcriptional regulator